MPNPCHLLEPFTQIIIAMIVGMVFKDRKHLIPMFLIEPWCLEVVGVEDHVLTSMGSRFLLCCVEELGPYPLSPKALTLSSRFAGRTRVFCIPSWRKRSKSLLPRSAMNWATISLLRF